jgi:hypothetical protein
MRVNCISNITWHARCEISLFLRTGYILKAIALISVEFPSTLTAFLVIFLSISCYTALKLRRTPPTKSFCLHLSRSSCLFDPVV